MQVLYIEDLEDNLYILYHKNLDCSTYQISWLAN